MKDERLRKGEVESHLMAAFTMWVVCVAGFHLLVGCKKNSEEAVERGESSEKDSKEVNVDLIFQNADLDLQYADLVFVPFNGPVEEVKGIIWPKINYGRVPRVAFQGPCKVHIRSPSGQVFKVEVHGGLIRQRGGTVSMVLLFSTPHPVSLSRALAKIETLLKALKVPEDSLASKFVDTLRADQPRPIAGDSKTCSWILEKWSIIEISLDSSVNEDGWFVQTWIGSIQTDHW